MSTKHIIKFLLLAILSTTISTVTIGCGGSTTHREVRTVDTDPGTHYETREVTTETTTDDDDDCGGILSCIVEGVGTIIALPFKAVGALIDVIF